ncbi:MAG: hypothetical protein ACAI38_21100 [Myxococcota bacterium]
MNLDKASGVVLRGTTRVGGEARTDAGTSDKPGGPALHTGRNPAADGIVRVGGQAPATQLSMLTRTTFDRAVTLVAVFGKTSDFADLKFDFTGDAGQAHRARAAVSDALQGWFPRWENPAFKFRQIGESICKAITGSLAWNVAAWPCSLFEVRSYPLRGLDTGRTSAEYIAAGLQLLTALAERDLVDLKAIVKPDDVKALVALVGAGRAMRDQSPTPALARSLPFLRVSAAKPSAGASATAFEDHFRSRGIQARAAAADVVTSAVAVLQVVAPEALAAIETTVRPATPAERLAVDTTLSAGGIEALAHVIEANKRGGGYFDTTGLRMAIERLVIEGFVDTPRSRERNAEAGRELIGAYIGALKTVRGSLAYTRREDATRAQTLCDELATLCSALRDGQLGAAVTARMHAFEYPQKVAQIAGSMRERLQPLAAGGDADATATLAAVERLSATFSAIEPLVHDFTGLSSEARLKAVTKLLGGYVDKLGPLERQLRYEPAAGEGEARKLCEDLGKLLQSLAGDPYVGDLRKHVDTSGIGRQMRRHIDRIMDQVQDTPEAVENGTLAALTRLRATLMDW